MKKLYCVVIMVLCAHLIFGQASNLKWGKPFTKKTLAGNFRVLRMNNEGLTLVTPTPAFMRASTSISVIKFDVNLNYLTLTKFALKFQERALDYEFTVPLSGRTLVFSSYVDVKAGVKILYCNEFNDEDQTLSSTTVKITEVPITKGPMPSYTGFDYFISPDSAILALVYSPPRAAEGKESFGFLVLDKNLNQLYKREEVFPFKDRNFNLRSAAVSPTGKVFLCGYLTSGPKNPFKKEPNYKYVIIGLDKNSEAPKIVDVDVEGKFVPDMKVICDYNGDLIGAGFYSKEGEFSIKGSFSIKIDGETGEIVNHSTKDFSVDFITMGMKAKQAERVESKADKGKNIEMSNYDLDYLLLRPDNGIYLVAQHSYSVTTTTTNSNGSTSTHTTYYDEDIIVIGMNENAEIDVAQKVLKKQKGSSTELIGYALGMKGSSLYFIFTDNALNNAPKPPYTEWATTSASAGVTTIACVDASGNVTRKNLMTFAKNKFYLWPRGAEMLKNGDLLLVTMKGSKAQLGLLSFE